MNTPMKTSWRDRFFVVDQAGAVITAALMLLLAVAWAPGAQAVDDCCNIISIDKGRGAVLVRELATGRTFTFTVKNRALLARLRPGMNFAARGALGRLVGKHLSSKTRRR